MLEPNSLTTRAPPPGQKSSPPPSSFLFRFLHSMNIRRLASISPSALEAEEETAAAYEKATVSPAMMPFSLTKRLQPRVST